MIVIEVKFLQELPRLVLRLPLITRYGDFHGENFELALQLHQLMLRELAEDMEETRPFERAREVLYKLGGRGYE